MGATWLLRSLIATAVRQKGPSKVREALTEAALWLLEQAPSNLDKQLRDLDPNQNDQVCDQP